MFPFNLPHATTDPLNVIVPIKTPINVSNKLIAPASEY